MRRSIRWGLAALAVALGLALVAARSLVPPAGPAVPGRSRVLDGVDLWNPGEPLRRGLRIEIRDGRIVDIRSRDGASDSPSRAVLMPGFVDMHAHFPPRILPGQVEHTALLYIAHGVTTVRDVGSLDGSIFATRDAIDAGRIAGPRIRACGPILDGEPPLCLGGSPLPEPSLVPGVVEDLVARGADCLKVCDGISAPVLAALRADAGRRGLPLVGHVPRSVSLEESALDDVQHLTGVVPHAARSATTLADDMIGWPQLSDERIEETVRDALERGAAHTPTLVVVDRLSRMASPEVLASDPAARLLPRVYRERLWSLQHGIPWLRGRDPAWWARYANARERMQVVVARLHQAGVTIHAGTDALNPWTVPGAALLEELRLLEEAGIPWEDVLSLATRAAARALGLDRGGRLEVGAPADAVLLRRDPRSGPEALETIEAVIVDGRRFDRDELLGAIERGVAHADGGFAGWLSEWAVRAALAAGPSSP